LVRVPEDFIVLDIGPTKGFADELRKFCPGRYISVDYDPSADSRHVDVQANLTNLPLRSESVGFLICSHVLEHIPEDELAMAEIRRVLGDESIGLIQLPRRLSTPTDEDPGASVKDRIARFDQADHVRLYGYDFEQRLGGAGLRVSTFRYSWILPRRALKLIGAGIDEELWLVTTGKDPVELVDGDAVFSALGRSLMRAENSPSALEARAEAEEWRSRYEWLHNRPMIRLASNARRQVKRFLRVSER
jgi:SAM-dependent methyltransferase